MSVKRPTFGQLFKELRMRNKLTLRQFCLDNGFDAGNISKLERGIYAAPQSEEKLREYAKALRLKEGTAQWIEFFDLAAVSARSLPLTNIKSEELLRKLPLLCRTLDNEDLTEEKLNRIVDLIRKANTTEK